MNADLGKGGASPSLHAELLRQKEMDLFTPGTGEGRAVYVVYLASFLLQNLGQNDNSPGNSQYAEISGERFVSFCARQKQHNFLLWLLLLQT